MEVKPKVSLRKPVLLGMSLAAAQPVAWASLKAWAALHANGRRSRQRVPLASRCFHAAGCWHWLHAILPSAQPLRTLPHPPASLRRWKADFKTTVEAQRGRKFEADTAKMYGMF